MLSKNVSHILPHLEAAAARWGPSHALCPCYGLVQAGDQWNLQALQAGETMMEGSKFAKLCKDSGLVDKKLSSTDVDLIFTKVTPFPYSAS